jgi:beta-glucanase (GH16 family)
MFTAGIILCLLTLSGVEAQRGLAAPPAGYTLVWNDEFTSSVTTPASVTYPSGDPNETSGSPPDPAFWSYDVGNNNGWGNEELETYSTSTTNASIEADPLGGAAHSTVLLITATQGGGIYDSARVKTIGSSTIGTQPQYGYFESQIAGPSGSGLWPAWWMEGTDLNVVGWPEAGEMDLFAEFGDNPTSEFSTDHYGTTNDAFSAGNSVAIIANQYNIYGLLRTPTLQARFLNGYSTGIIGEPYNSQNLGGVFNQPFFFLYDLAIGTASSPGGQLASNEELPASLKIGYLRVYQPTGSVQTAGNTANNTPTVLAGGSHPIAPSTYQVTPQSATGTRLDLAGNTTTNGNGIDAVTSNGSSAQAWTFSTTPLANIPGVVPTGDYNIGIHSNFCLQAGGWFPGAFAEIWSCNNNSLQSWNVVPSNAGDYQIQMATIPPTSEESPSPAALCLYDISGIIQLEACDTSGSDEFAILPLTPLAPTGLGCLCGRGRRCAHYPDMDGQCPRDRLPRLSQHDVERRSESRPGRRNRLRQLYGHQHTHRRGHVLLQGDSGEHRRRIGIFQ